MKRWKRPPQPTHVAGIHRGEELALEAGQEPGRGDRSRYRSARDSTSINPQSRGPIHPAMPDIPPA